MKKILLITGYYLPGFKAGGPIQSVRGIAWLLKNKYSINILTRDRDLGDKEPYHSIQLNNWNLIEEIKTLYVPIEKIRSLKFLNFLINKERYDIIYLQSFFDSYTRKILFLKKFKMINCKILLAPRGEFGVSALEKSKIKKKIYLKIFKFFLFDKNINWHATSSEEEQCIVKNFKNPKIYRLDNIKKIERLAKKNIKKEVNKVKFVFVSRIVDHKNLYFFLERLERIKNNNYEISLDIYGPLENESYWKKCEKKILEISANIKIKYKGNLKNEEVVSVIKNYHYLVLPTKGENFGHIIMESLLSQTPLIISDRTPWQKLNSDNLGYDIPLENEKLWSLKIEEIIKQTDEDYKLKVNDIKKFCNKNFGVERKKDEYVEALEKILD